MDQNEIAELRQTVGQVMIALSLLLFLLMVFSIEFESAITWLGEMAPVYMFLGSVFLFCRGHLFTGEGSRGWHTFGAMASIAFILLVGYTDHRNRREREFGTLMVQRPLNQSRTLELVRWNRFLRKAQIGKTGRWAIHYACESGHLDMVKYLLSKGTDPNIRDDQARSPIYFACWAPENSEAIQLLLLENGATVDPLQVHRVVQFDQVEVLKALSAQGVNKDYIAPEGRYSGRATVLEVAERYDSRRCLAYLKGGR